MARTKATEREMLANLTTTDTTTGAQTIGPAQQKKVSGSQAARARARSAAAGLGADKMAGKKPKAFKVTARQATGPPAPRIALGSMSSVLIPASSQIATAPPFLDSQPSRTFTLSGSDWEITATGTLTPALDTAGDAYCFGCRDGGLIVSCGQGTCERGMCLECLQNPSDALLKLTFICPPCYTQKEKMLRKKKKKRAFIDRKDGQHVVLNKALSSRSMTAGASSASVLLLVYALEGLPLETTPVPLLVSQMHLLFPNNCMYIPITFNLLVNRGPERLQEANEALACALKTGFLKSVRNICVVYVSHTDPRGDIHFAPDNAGSQEPKALLPLFFPPSLAKAFVSCGRQQTGNLILFLLCGSIFNVQSSLQQMFDWFVKSKAFYGLLGFDAEKLQPGMTSYFLLRVMESFYFNKNPNFINMCLSGSGNLGSHSGIVYFRGDGTKPRRYLWSHPVRAPFGRPVPISCTSCSSVFCLSPAQKLNIKERLDPFSEIVELWCEFCSHVLMVEKPEEFEFTKIAEADGVWGYDSLEL